MNFWAEANQIQKFLRGRSNIIQTTMGIDGLLKELHGGRMTEQSVGFAELNKWLHKSKTPIDVDTGTLLFVCAYRHRHAYNAGDYLPSVLAFHRQLIILSVGCITDA